MTAPLESGRRQTPQDERVFSDMDEPTLTLSSPNLAALIRFELADASLEAEQRARSMRGLAMIVGIALFGACTLQTVDERGPAHVALTAGLLGLAGVSGAQLHRIRKGHTYDRSHVVIAAALADLAAAAYVGLFSLVTVPLPIIVLFAGQDKRVRAAWAVYLVCAIGIAVLTLLAAIGLLDPTSSVLALETHPGRRLFSLMVFLELILGIAFAMASNFRKTTEQAMQDLTRAHGEIRRKDALLREERAGMERWNAAGGRFTGQEVESFRIGEIIGRGGMGDVYEAEHPELGSVALKILHSHLREQGDALQRFFREARIMSDLESPHIVRILSTATTTSGAPYLAMERLEGEDLATLLRKRGSLPLDEVVALVRDVSRALAAAHAAGIVHRDIKPQNLFQCRGRDGALTWKVLDFGISKINELASTLTEGKVLGTPGYMAPEQARGDHVDGRADVCSLAMVSYRALTGRGVFRGREASEIIYGVLHCTPLSPRSYVDVPEDVEFVFALALAKSREHRFPSVEDFARAFEAAAASHLDPGIRDRAKAQLEAAPWGTDLSVD